MTGQRIRPASGRIVPERRS
uniref:Uncharacterized protein n=1 Tax=Arundo donax TaxID=35708 RepID=A0A0A8ZYV8_ARUDO